MTAPLTIQPNSQSWQILHAIKAARRAELLHQRARQEWLKSQCDDLDGEIYADFAQKAADAHTHAVDIVKGFIRGNVR